MIIKATEIKSGQHIILKGYKSYRILHKIKESVRTITFCVNHYIDDQRCIGNFIKKEITFRKSTTVETREEFIGTKLDQLHRIKSERLKSCLKRGFELYKVKVISQPNYEEFEIGDFMFAMFNGINYETETILDDGTVNVIPPSKNSDKPQLSGWSNRNGGFEDFYEKVDIKILLKQKINHESKNKYLSN